VKGAILKEHKSKKWAITVKRDLKKLNTTRKPTSNV
jgi:hypothetical protein